MAIGNANEYELDELVDAVEEEEDLDTDPEEEEEEDDADKPEGEEEEEGEEDDDDESDHEDDDESQTTPPKDKKESKIVSLKRQVKEANKRIAELEEKRENEILEAKMNEKREELLDDGMSEKDVEEYITVMKENALLKQAQENIVWKELSEKYPTIGTYKQEILKIKKSLPDATIEDIFLTKFSKESAYDQKTRIQQEMKFQQSKAQDKGKGSASGKPTGTGKDAVKLSPESEKAYQILLKSNPSMTRKRFQELDAEEELT